MKPALALFLLLGSFTVAGATKVEPSLEHRIKIPFEFSGGRSEPHGLSSVERYTDGYEQGWWYCVEIFTKDIRHQTTIADLAACSGSGEFISGFSTGYTDAEKRLRKLVATFGEKRVVIFLHEFAQAIDQEEPSKSSTAQRP